MKFNFSRRFLLLLPGVFIAAIAGGCANTDAVRVKPWEHAALADYTMQPGRDPLASSMSEHVFFSREAASGGRGVGGSGCGCN